MKSDAASKRGDKNWRAALLNGFDVTGDTVEPLVVQGSSVILINLTGPCSSRRPSCLKKIQLKFSHFNFLK